MAVSFVKNGGTADQAGSTSHAITVPAGGHAAGNLIAVFMNSGSNPGTVTVDDNRSGSNSYTVSESNFDAGEAIWVGIAWCKISVALQAGDIITVHFTGSADSQCFSAEYTSTNGFNTVDQHTHKTNGFGLPWTTGSVTTTVASEVLLSICTPDATVSNTSTANWNERYDHANVTASRYIIVQDRFVSSTLTVDEGGTLSGNAGSVAAVVTISENVGPTITTQPTNQTTYSGNTETFTVSANGSGSLSYQWKQNGSNVGTNSSSYTTDPLAISDNASTVSCDVTDSNATTSSNTVYIFVWPTSSVAWIDI